ncbi:hypothetical protein [Luteimonas sp. A501]
MAAGEASPLTLALALALLAAVVQAASSSPFADAARQRVLVPAGMQDSVIRLQAAAPLAPRPAPVPLADEHLELVGEHRHPDFGPLVIARAPGGNSLMLTLPEKPTYWSFHLTPISNGGLHWRAFNRVLRSNEAGGLAE